MATQFVGGVAVHRAECRGPKSECVTAFLAIPGIHGIRGKLNQCPRIKKAFALSDFEDRLSPRRPFANTELIGRVQSRHGTYAGRRGEGGRDRCRWQHLTDSTSAGESNAHLLRSTSRSNTPASLAQSEVQSWLSSSGDPHQCSTSVRKAKSRTNSRSSTWPAGAAKSAS